MCKIGGANDEFPFYFNEIRKWPACIAILLFYLNYTMAQLSIFILLSKHRTLEPAQTFCTVCLDISSFVFIFSVFKNLALRFLFVIDLIFSLQNDAHFVKHYLFFHYSFLHRF